MVFVLITRLSAGRLATSVPVGYEVADGARSDALCYHSNQHAHVKVVSVVRDGSGTGVRSVSNPQPRLITSTLCAKAVIRHCARTFKVCVMNAMTSRQEKSSARRG